MAEAQEDDEIFVYMGGDQEVPDDVRRARIHKSVKSIPRYAFYKRRNLSSVEFHDEIEIIEEEAFKDCYSLRGCIKLLGVKIVKGSAFDDCRALTDVEFGDVLEAIKGGAFFGCSSLRSITMPSVRTIGFQAFACCYELSDVVCGKRLQLIEASAFRTCLTLKRIVLPLKDYNIIDASFFGVFQDCPKLARVDLVGGFSNTVESLHMESWRNEVMDEINSINQDQVLLLHDNDTLPDQKTIEIRQWMESVIRRLNHYKAEHHQILKEATTLLELALWKANLDDNKGGEREGVRTTRGSRKRARKEICVTSGASIVIKNVLPFLVLKS